MKTTKYSRFLAILIVLVGGAQLEAQPSNGLAPEVADLNAAAVSWAEEANGHGNWSAHGLDYYVLCKALWNPDLDVAANIADYCRAAYGPAAEVMQQYHDTLAGISDQVRADPELGPRKPHAARLRRYYNQESLQALEAFVKNAQAEQGDDPGVKARIQMAADAVKYVRLVTSLLEVAHDKKSPVLAERLAAVESFLKSKVFTPELAPLHSHRYLRMALAYAEREVE